MLLNKINSVLHKLGYETLGCDRVELESGRLVLENAVKFTFAALDHYITIEGTELTCWKSNGDIDFMINIKGLPDYQVLFKLGYMIGRG